MQSGEAEGEARAKAGPSESLERSSTIPLSGVLTSAGPTLEALTRMGAVGVAITYALGVLVVTLYQGRYGVWPIEILKPRAFAAGALMVVTYAIGLLLAFRAYGLLGFSTGDDPVDEKSAKEKVSPGLARAGQVVGFYTDCLFAAGLLSMGIFEDEAAGWNIWSVVALGCFVVAIGFRSAASIAPSRVAISGTIVTAVLAYVLLYTAWSHRTAA
jgi:hypothetical protein